MKKTLLAVAIPALLASGAASATTLYNAEGTKIDIKGQLRIALEYKDNRDAAGEDGTKFRDLGSRFGFKVTHDLGDGLYGLGELEFGNNTQANEKDETSYLRNRLAYVGLGMKDVGEFTFGRVLSPFDDVAQSDYSYDYGGILDFGHGVSRNSKETDNFIGRVSNTAKFMSADFNGFSFGTTYTTQSSENWTDAEAVRNAYTLSAFYDTGFGLKVNAGYGHAKLQTQVMDKDELDIWGVSAEYTVNALSVAVDLGQAQNKFNVAGSSWKPKTDLYGLGAKYNLDKVNLYTGFYYGKGNDDTNNSKKRTVVVGTDYQFTPSVRTYVEYANVNQKWDNVATKKDNKAMIGMRVYF